MKNLVIVESPTKAKTIKKFLPRGFKVESSYGHIRDLPKKKLGVDVEHNFEPEYTVPEKSAKTVSKLKKLAKESDNIFFATDDDREGEAISWHLAELLGIDSTQSKRIVFHEITKPAILGALEKPRTIDKNLVDAQQARRVLDRLVGYKLSPLLWKKVTRGLSAGRVQSVAVRMIVEREREIQNFKAEEYWKILGYFNADDSDVFESHLLKIDNKSIKKFDINNEKQATQLVDDIRKKAYTITDVSSKTKKRAPQPPFKTSTLQQAANNKLGFSTKQTMRLAQQLYEGIDLGDRGTVGLITYMRTDSLNLSDQFLKDAQEVITKEYGEKYHTGKSRVYKTTAKGAQEAHEAIRPTHAHYSPEDIKQYLDQRQFKLYQLIWQRAIASQMADAQMKSTSIDIESEKKEFTFRAKGSIIEFDGYTACYPVDSKETILPDIKNNTPVHLKTVNPTQHFTQPPARYSEATLVKALEEHGIGRPSTYAPTIHTIQERNYVKKEDKKLAPTDIAFVVNDLLVNHFPSIVDFEFTAGMENELDEIAEGKQKWNKAIKEFYTPFIDTIKEKEKTIDKKEITEEKTDEKCDKCGSGMVIKIGRFGKFMACSNYPDCKSTKPIPGSEDEKMQEQATDEKCDKCGEPMVIKTGRFGPFLGCSGYPDCKNIKSIEKGTGVSCPDCKKGEVVEKRTKTKRIFYGCNKYPKCEFALWSKPTGEQCPDCKSLLVFGAKNTHRCSNKECKYKKTVESAEE